jgi:aryl-alcohol dehydrogenase-like predicted oxidoreductase
MRTTTLGACGPQVGVIGLGCMGMTHAYDLDTPRDDRQSIGVIHQALELGMNLIDTADVYGPYTNEELVGQALADRSSPRRSASCGTTPTPRRPARARLGSAETGGPSTCGRPSTTASGDHAQRAAA